MWMRMGVRDRDLGPAAPAQARPVSTPGAAARRRKRRRLVVGSLAGIGALLLAFIALAAALGATPAATASPRAPIRTSAATRYGPAADQVQAAIAATGPQQQSN